MPRTFKPKEDAEVVKKLTEAQALILGKVNLSELANYMSMKAPSGYSSKHGQTQSLWATQNNTFRFKFWEWG